MKIDHRWLAFALVFAPAVLGAQERPTLLLPWGLSDGQLGVFRDGDYLRGPAFFDQGTDGSLWVADAYKERIVQYTAEGRFLQAVDVPEVSPRMAAFRVVEDGSFALLNDQTLSRWTSRGESLGHRGLGLVLPEAVWFTSDWASVVVRNDSGWSSQIWDRTFQSQTQFSLSSPSGSKAALKDIQGRFRMAFWGDQAAVFGWKAPVDSNAMLLRALNAETIWSVVVDGKRLFWWIDAVGNLKARASIPTTPGAPGLFSIGAGARLLWGQWTDAGLLLDTASWLP